MAATPVEQARAFFRDSFGNDTQPHVAVAPGRINLIGEHTDYNDGFVLPMAIDAHVAIAFAPRRDNILRACSKAFGETKDVVLGELIPPGGNEWFDYLAAVAWAIREAGWEVQGMNMAIAGDVPVGAGLASSAALELAAARAIAAVSRIGWDAVRMACVCRTGENAYVGVNCGIMDQYAASVSAAGSALLVDCRTLRHDYVPIPHRAQFVVMDSGVRRTLATSEYNERKASCDAAVEILRRVNASVRALRDVDEPTLERCAPLLDHDTYRRAKHVVSEIRRPAQMAFALRNNDLELAGTLMDESHASLRDLFGVSCSELDLITTIARRHDGCFGARMTGAGFGGCAIALVAREQADDFLIKVSEDYSAVDGTRGALYACEPSAGAALIV